MGMYQLLGHFCEKIPFTYGEYKRASSFAFLAPFYLRIWHLPGFKSGGKVFGKAVRTLGLDARKCRWVVQQDLQLGIFGSTLQCFCLSSPASLPESCF